jgi:hypothetical protein
MWDGKNAIKVKRRETLKEKLYRISGELVWIHREEKM